STGTAYRVAGSHTDVTARKTSEEALRRSEALLRVVLENLPVGVWIVDRTGHILLQNSVGLSILGGGAEALGALCSCRARWADTGKPLRPSDWGVARAVRFGETALNETLEIDAFDGRRKIVSVSAVPIGHGEERVGAIALVEDISDRKRTERALRRSEEKYRKLFEESRDGIYILSADGSVVDVNPALCSLFGYTRDEMLSLDLARDVYRDTEDLLLLQRLLERDGYVRDLEVELVRKDGETLTAYNSASVILTERGKAGGYWGIVHDVTDRKRLHEQLLQAQKMESIGLLAGGIAHDFNNMLTAISGYAQLIEEHEAASDDMISHAVERILTASERAVTLTQNLLAFSRKQIINPKPILLNDVIVRTADMCSMIVREDVRFSVELQEDLVALADAGQIEQVLVNLVTNACDAMPEGGTLSVSAGKVVLGEECDDLYFDVEPGEYTRITVSDTGVGMDEATRKKMFEPFFTTKETGRGTGLGLSIIYGIIRQHNGNLRVTSERGAGSVFEIFLPVSPLKVHEQRCEA
ncbi:MAG TPA: PAS domain S-box protein, partial [Verrucomicrobiae bacterium]|nr:PAS domain S-box protein [Verrucomicrobiae bacterium]